MTDFIKEIINEESKTIDLVIETPRCEIPEFTYCFSATVLTRIYESIKARGYKIASLKIVRKPATTDS